MPKPQIVTGLDIGTSNIKLLVVAKKQDDPNLEVLFCEQEPSFGVRKGIVIENDQVSRIIQRLLEKAKLETGYKINSAFVNINGSHIFALPSRGMVAVSRADRNVSNEDVDRVIQAAETVSLPSHKEILNTFPKEFIIDGEGGIKKAAGLQGGRLEVEVLLLGGVSSYKNNLREAVLDTDFQTLEIVPSALATSLSVISKKQKELGVALLDIGAGTSELAVFEEGDLVHLAVFPVGSAYITNDIAVGLKTDIDTAEAIKIKCGSCASKGKDKKEKLEIEGEEPLVFSHKMLNKIVSARTSQIFREVQKELKKISKSGALPAGIVITGGGAKIPKIVELAKKELKLPCRIGKMSELPSLEGNPTLATVCGLVLEGINSEEDGTASKFSKVRWVGTKIKRFFQNFIP